MFLGIRKRYWFVLIATAITAGAVVFASLSPVFAVRRIDLTGPFAAKLERMTQREMISPGSVFRIDKKELAEEMLLLDYIENVSLSLDFPYGIKGEINRFQPVALVLTDNLYGLDQYCRLLPYDSAWTELDLPVLTGLGCNRLFRGPGDFRVANVVAGLREIELSLPDLYRQIAEIDFSDRVYVGIYLTTGSNRFTASSRDFASQLWKLEAVKDSAARSADGSYNLIYDGVVVKEK